MVIDRLEMRRQPTAQLERLRHHIRGLIPADVFERMWHVFLLGVNVHQQVVLALLFLGRRRSCALRRVAIVGIWRHHGLSPTQSRVPLSKHIPLLWPREVWIQD
jgi:hypothetical protein